LSASSPGRALVVVNYRSSPFALEAIRSARRASSEPLHVVVVDNSVDESEAAALRGASDVLLTPPSNLGYAAAINLARRSLDAELMIVANPDVVFGPDAIDALDIGVPVAGPALYWDDAYTWMLPPADRHTTRERLDAALAIRSRAWARARDRRRFRGRVSFWSRTVLHGEPLPQRSSESQSAEGAAPWRVGAISGAVMAIRTDTFDRLGGFDDRFFLYFEETDFLRRASEVWYVPQARCRHIYNQSAAGSPEAARHYAESERKYLEKWSGKWMTTLVKSMESRPATEQPGNPMTEIYGLKPGMHVVEVSPLATFDTAAGLFPQEQRVAIPAEVLSSYRGGVLWLRVVERASGMVLANYTLRIDP
jgi:GT2 family glycosyltransferase